MFLGLNFHNIAKVPVTTEYSKKCTSAGWVPADIQKLNNPGRRKLNVLKKLYF